VTPQVCVVGLGPGRADLVTARTLALIAEHPVRFVRTLRHPSAGLVADAPRGCSSFDDLYDAADSFDELYAAIVERLAEAAAEHGRVLYAVPGSPLVLERTVELLRARSDLDTVVHPGVSFLDEAWRALGVDPVTAGVTLADAYEVARDGFTSSGPVLVAHVHARWLMSEIKLALADPPEGTVAVICHHLGLDDERLVTVDWPELDRTVEPDHLTCLWLPRIPSPVGDELARFHRLSLTLREKCPWDIEQTHESLVRHLLEETHELIEAIENAPTGDPLVADADLVEELGDVLYQVAFHCAIAEEEGRFDLATVARRAHDKLVSRHPHVFGGTRLDAADDVVEAWEQIKKREKPDRTGIFDGLVEAMPALLLADKTQRRASREGWDWADPVAALDKVTEETTEVADALAGSGGTAAELGDLLFSAVNVARLADVDPEAALRGAVRRFRARVLAAADLAAAEGRRPADLDQSQLDDLWERAKGIVGGPDH
jgi:tetrapyrrole methylase family protein/MazG family protein